jgi:nucleotidyltransferase substrate binding protein (TIGR01987 family)
MPLDLESFEKAVAALRLSSTEAVPFLADYPPAVREAVRAGIIQQFEVAYEQSWKSMRRWLEENVGADAVDGVPRRELFRRAAESRLIVDVERWMSFHRGRNETSHTYSSEAAREVYDLALGFLPDVEQLLVTLHSRNT